MAVPAWFDVNVYLANKLAQLQKANPSANWTSASLASALTAAGFLGTDGAYDHFVKFGASENLSPNSLFSPDEYFQAKAVQFYKKPAASVTDLEISTLKQLFANAGLNAWTHYVQFGSAEGVNPSNSFDESDYLAAKLAALKVADPTNWGTKTVADVSAAFKAAGFSALTHFLTFKGTGTAEVAATATFPVPDTEKVTPTTSTTTGQTFTLTTGVENITGTSGNDTVTAVLSATAGETTFNTGDTINMGAGTDRLNLIITGAPDRTLPTVKSVEDVYVTNTGAITGAGKEVSGATFEGLQKLVVSKSQDNIKIIDLDKAVTLGIQQGTAGKTIEAVFTSTTGTSDTVNVALDAAKASTVTIAQIENINISTTGTSAITALTVAQAEKLVVTGDGKTNLTLAAGNIVKTVDASKHTGGLTINIDNNAQNVTFTGGSGADTVAILAAQLNSNDKLNGGDGTDTLQLVSTGGALNYTTGNAALVSAINAQTNFEVLSFKSDNAVTLTGDQFATIKTFDIATTGAASVTKLQAGTTITVDSLTVGGTTLGGDTGVTSVSINLTSDAAAANTGAVDVSAGLNTVNINSAGKIANVIGAVTNNANTTFKIEGARDLSITSFTNAAVVNADTFTGKLTLAGSTGNDSIKVGTGGSAITADTGADLYTLGAGKDVLTFALAANVNLGNLSNVATLDKVVGFATGTDVLQFDDANVTALAKATASQLSAVQTAVNGLATTATITDAIAAAAAALNVDNSGVTAGSIYNFTFKGNTYVAVDSTNAAGAASDTNSAVIELTGVTTFAFATDVVII